MSISSRGLSSVQSLRKQPPSCMLLVTVSEGKRNFKGPDTSNSLFQLRSDVTSIHNSLTKTSYLAPPNHKGATKYNPPVCLKYLVNYINNHHTFPAAYSVPNSKLNETEAQEVQLTQQLHHTQ